MNQISRIDKRKHKGNYLMACDGTALMISQPSGRGHETVFIKIADAERFLADLDFMVTDAAMLRRGS